MSDRRLSAAGAIETVQRFYDAAGNRAGIDQVMSQDVVWDITPGFLRGGVYGTGCETGPEPMTSCRKEPG